MSWPKTTTISLGLCVSDGSGIGTRHSRVACLFSVMSRATAGKAWLAKGNSSSWGLLSSGGPALTSLAPGLGSLPGWTQLGLSGWAERWHVASPRSSSFSQHGTSSHRSWMFQDSQERSHIAFSDLVLETTWHHLNLEVKVITNLLSDEGGTYSPPSSWGKQCPRTWEHFLQGSTDWRVIGRFPNFFNLKI